MEKRYYARESESLKLIHVGTLYSICVILFLLANKLFINLNFYVANLTIQFAFILLPAALFLVLFKFDVKKILRLNKIKFKTLIIIFFLMVSSMPLAGVFNLLNQYLVKVIFGEVELLDIPIENTLPGVMLVFFLVGIAAGICEEVLFRGIIQRGFERYGVKKAIIITALLFGLMHFDFQRLFGTFLLGALIGFIAYRTNSLYSGIFAHFVNNSVALLTKLYYQKLNEFSMDVEIGANALPQLENIPVGDSVVTVVAFIIGFLIALAFFAGFFILFMVLFIKNTSKTEVDVIEEKEPVMLKDILVFVPGLLVVVYVYIEQGARLIGL